MRINLKDRHEAAHFWANQVQPEGKAGNVFFQNGKIYSYGQHFCIARHLSPGVIAMTTRGYSPSTSTHISIVRQAARHLRTVYCNDPGGSARQNMMAARNEINDALYACEKKGIRQTTRDKHRVAALHIAEQANAYLAALPEVERGIEVPIDTSTLDAIRADYVAAEAAREKVRAEQQAVRMAALAESAEEWRAGKVLVRTGLWEIPPMLRVSSDGANVQTSHGAEIPVADAIRIWPVIRRVMAGERDYEPGEPLGHYRLSKIRRDGSIVVGCHDIAHSEIARIAVQLGV